MKIIASEHAEVDEPAGVVLHMTVEAPNGRRLGGKVRFGREVWDSKGQEWCEAWLLARLRDHGTAAEHGRTAGKWRRWKAV